MKGVGQVVVFGSIVQPDTLLVPQGEMGQADIERKAAADRTVRLSRWNELSVLIDPGKVEGSALQVPGLRQTVKNRAPLSVDAACPVRLRLAYRIGKLKIASGFSAACGSVESPSDYLPIQNYDAAALGSQTQRLARLLAGLAEKLLMSCHTTYGTLGIMDPQIKQLLDEQQKKIDAIYVSVEKTRKYMLWTIIATVALFVLPLLAAAFILPSAISSYTSTLTDLGL
jgi:hypothetical protein